MKRLRHWAALLCVCLLLAACGGPTAETSPGPQAQEMAMGRYVEEKTSLPGLSEVTVFDQVAPDTFYVMGFDGKGERTSQIWYSGDGGHTWEEKHYPFLESLEVLGAAFAADGSFYMTYVDMAEYVDEDTFIVKTAFADENGMEDIQDIPELEAFNSGLLLTRSGDLLINQGFGMEQVSPQTGAVRKYELMAGQLWNGNYVTRDDKLAICTGPEILLFDTVTGDSLDSLPVEGTGFASAITFQEDGSGFFYCNSGGLYRVTMDGAITEQLIDGALASFGMPTAYLYGMAVCRDGSFLLLYSQNGAYQLVRFVFDQTISREPGQELTVYSLRDNDFIRQVAGLYQRDNPDVMVRYQVGAGEDSAVSVDDAMRTLSAELLAGNGPDILVLDGLPIDSYLRHDGVLLDLSEPLEDVLGGLLPAAAGAFTDSSGALRAIPARVSVPLVAGAGVEEIHDATGLADYVERQEQHRIGVTPESVMEQFYPACLPGWFDGDGNLDTEALARDLAAIERIVAMGEAHPYNRDLTGVLHQSVWWNGGGLGVIFSPLSTLDDIAALYTAFDEKGEGTVKLFPDETRGVLVPSSILGVYGGSGQTDTAVDFIRAALELEAQRSQLRDGLPVLSEALDWLVDSKEPDTSLNAIGTSYNDGSGDSFDMEIIWPSREKTGEMLALIQSAQSISYSDEIIRQMFFDETDILWAGARTVEDTVQALSVKVERYVQEQG